MCNPVAIAVAGISVIQAQQAQAAADDAADMQNKAFTDNQRLQNEAYAKDMEAFWNKEIDYRLQGFKNAEDASQAKVEAQIEAQEAMASMKLANLTAGSGKSGARSMNVLRRQLANRYVDIDDKLLYEQFGLKRNVDSLQFDKIARRNSAIGKINSVQRADYADSGTRALNLITSGISGYSTGLNISNAMGPSVDPGVTPPQGTGTGKASGTGFNRGRNTFRQPRPSRLSQIRSGAPS